jgi:broad specificity phosphatase PhoE
MMSTNKIMIVRHAEKPGGDMKGVTPDGDVNAEDLTVRGWQRAGALVGLFLPPGGHFSSPHLATPQTLYASGVGAHSNSLRPQHTVQPLADRLKKQIDTSFLKGEEAALVSAISTAGGVVLVAWEHEHIPQIAAGILGRSGSFPAKWPDDRFDLVWVFDRPGGAGQWSFMQIPQLLLVGDETHLISLVQGD